MEATPTSGIVWKRPNTGSSRSSRPSGHIKCCRCALCCRAGVCCHQSPAGEAARVELSGTVQISAPEQALPLLNFAVLPHVSSFNWGACSTRVFLPIMRIANKSQSWCLTPVGELVPGGCSTGEGGRGEQSRQSSEFPKLWLKAVALSLSPALGPWL